jgi:hypothetical protein
MDPFMAGYASVPDLDTDRFVLFQMERLLPETVTIECDRELRIASLLVQQESGGSLIIEQQQFTDQEFDVLIALFEQLPDFTPLADLLAAQSGQSLTRCQRDVTRALDDGLIDELIRPVRNVLSRARIKLRHLGLDIRSIQETGYLIIVDREVYRRQ